MSQNAFEKVRREKRLNHLCKAMDQYHGHFKSQFNTLHDLADGSYERRGLSLSSFLELGRDLITYLTMHHSLEERHLFPILAKRMPQFGQEDGGEHLESHRKIHDGLDNLSALTTKWSLKPSTYSPSEMRACLDEFREVLFNHLDAEVADLQGENLLKYFTYEEIARFPF